MLFRVTRVQKVDINLKQVKEVVYHAYHRLTMIKKNKLRVKVAWLHFIPMKRYKQFVRAVQVAKNRKQAVLLVHHVLLGKLVQRVTTVLSVSFVLVQMIKQQFAVIVQKASTKKMKVKDRVFHAFLANMNVLIESNVTNVRSKRIKTKPVNRVAKHVLLDVNQKQLEVRHVSRV